MPASLESIFESRFNAKPTHRAVAPGRINLIGEHTDYNEGFVFPAAIDKELRVVARVVDGPSRITSDEMGDGEEFDVRRLSHGAVGGWTAYVAGVAWALQQHGFDQLPNIEAAVESDIPIGSGVSSSAAIELAFAVLWNDLGRLALDGKELAKIGQYAENHFVGVACGIMDQMASAMGRKDHAMFLDTLDLNIDYAPIPSGVAIVLCDTKTPRSLTDSAYNERRSQCEQAARVLGVASLRHATPDQVEEAKDRMGDLVYRRAKHVTTENHRCLQFKEALSARQATELGRLMRDSHQSLRFDYEVSSPELDAMAEASWAAPGCIGARMTGAGFGGACVALVDDEQVEPFCSAVLESYRERTGIEGALLPCKAVDGARMV